MTKRLFVGGRWDRMEEVALDPKRNFGHPIVFETGVPTLTLARSVKANQSTQEVARWLEIRPKAVKEAVAFEQQLAA